MGRLRAKHEWVVFAQQDVHLPEGWDRRLAQQIGEAERRMGPIGVAGVYGVGEVISPADPTRPLAAGRIGWVVDRGRELRDGPELPAQVATLDDMLLVVRRGCTAPVRPGARVPPLCARTSASRRLKRALRSWRWRHCAITIPGASGCPRRSSPARRSSQRNGADGCRSPRRASSSTAPARSACWATPRMGRHRSPTLCRTAEKSRRLAAETRLAFFCVVLRDFSVVRPNHEHRRRPRADFNYCALLEPG